MNFTPKQREIVEFAAERLNRALAWSPLVVVPRWRLQELEHVDSDSRVPDRDGRLDLILRLIPYRYLLLFELARRVPLRRGSRG